MKKLMLSVFALTAVVLSAGAQQTNPISSATAASKITIVTPLTISKDVDMDFGTVAVAATSSTIQLAAATGTLIPTIVGAASVVSTSTPTAAKFTVGGQGNAAFSISIPTPVSVTDLTPSNGAAMSLALVCDQTGTAPSYTSVLASGTKVIYVGGTLSIGASQAASAYQGTITVNVNYN